MIGSHSHQASLAQRTGFALAEALRRAQAADLLVANGRIRRISDLLIDGVRHDQLPDSIDRTRLRSPHSATALAVNSFLRWQDATDQLPLAGWTGFDAVQFEVRCPTGLRGTPPHLDLLALRGEAAIAVTARCFEYLSRRKTAVAASYDQLLATIPELEPWRRQLDRMRTEPQHYRHIDSGALIKFALALGRTFPERPTTLLYLYWEPLDADQFEEFGSHRREASELTDAVRDSRVTFAAQSFAAMWREWAAREVPSWLAAHVERLRARYCVRVAPARRR
jgi:hypothetical protein